MLLGFMVCLVDVRIHAESDAVEAESFVKLAGLLASHRLSIDVDSVVSRTNGDIGHEGGRGRGRGGQSGDSKNVEGSLRDND